MMSAFSSLILALALEAQVIDAQIIPENHCFK